MIRKNPCHDTTAGSYTFPAEPLTEGSKRLVKDLSKRVTWDRPLKGNESAEEAYARGWADAVAKFELEQRLVKFGYNLDELDRDNPYNKWMENL